MEKDVGAAQLPMDVRLPDSWICSVIHLTHEVLDFLACDRSHGLFQHSCKIWIHNSSVATEVRVHHRWEIEARKGMVALGQN